jgi:hypothetical protein
VKLQISSEETVKGKNVKSFISLILLFSPHCFAVSFDIPGGQYDSVILPKSDNGFECVLNLSDFYWKDNFGPTFMLNAHTENRDEFSSVRMSKTKKDNMLFFMFQNGSTVIDDTKDVFLSLPYVNPSQIVLGLVPLSGEVPQFRYYAKLNGGIYSSGTVLNPKLDKYGYSVDISSLKGSYECSPL